MKICIPGGTGQVGQLLARHFIARGDDVTILTRGVHHGVGRGVQWDGKSPGEWTAAIDGADVVINLAGRTVNCRYNAANQKQMMDSRVDSTRAIGRAIADAKSPPRIWLQASTATLYRHTFGQPNPDYSETSGIHKFPANVDRCGCQNAVFGRTGANCPLPPQAIRVAGGQDGAGKTAVGENFNARLAAAW